MVPTAVSRCVPLLYSKVSPGLSRGCCPTTPRPLTSWTLWSLSVMIQCRLSNCAATLPVSAEEVNRAKAALLKNIELQLANSEQVGFALTEWASMGDWRLLFLHRDRIEKVTPADVQRVAAAYLKPSNRTSGKFVPTSKPDRAVIPPLTSAEQMVASYTGHAVVAAGETFDVAVAYTATGNTGQIAAGHTTKHEGRDGVEAQRARVRLCSRRNCWT